MSQQEEFKWDEIDFNLSPHVLDSILGVQTQREPSSDPIQTALSLLIPSVNAIVSQSDQRVTPNQLQLEEKTLVPEENLLAQQAKALANLIVHPPPPPVPEQQQSVTRLEMPPPPVPEQQQSVTRLEMPPPPVPEQQQQSVTGLEMPPPPPVPEPMEEVKEPTSRKRSRGLVYGLTGGERYRHPQDFTFVPESFADIETAIPLRMDLLRIVSASLEHVPRDACFDTIVDAGLDRSSGVELGRGRYGIVMKLYVKDTELPVAVKYVPLKSDEANARIVQNSYREIIILTYLNALVKSAVCPNFPLLYEPFMCHNPQTGYVKEINIVQELSDGTAHTWLQTRRTKAQLFSFIFQICAAILAAQTLLGLVNNDLKSDNILYNNIHPDTLFVYNIYGQQYSTRTDFLFKMADWGLGSGMGTFLGRSHDYIPSMFEKEKRVQLQSWADEKAWTVNYQNHPLSFRIGKNETLPPWKRDYLSFCYMLMAIASIGAQPEMPVAFIKSMITTLATRKLGLDTNENRVALFHFLFSQQVLNKTMGPDGVTLLYPSATSPPPTSRQQFQMSGAVLQDVHLDAERRLPHLVAPEPKRQKID